MSRFYVLGEGIYDSTVHTNIPKQATPILEKDEPTFMARPTPYHNWVESKWILTDIGKQAIINLIIGVESDRIKKEIINGFVFKERNFYLSLERQQNYQNDYNTVDFIVFPYQTTDVEDQTLIFETKEEFVNFYMSMVAYIRSKTSEALMVRKEIYEYTVDKLITTWKNNYE